MFATVPCEDSRAAMSRPTVASRKRTAIVLVPTDPWKTAKAAIAPSGASKGLRVSVLAQKLLLSEDWSGQLPKGVPNDLLR